MTEMNGTRTTSVSLFNDVPENDFPVLKAFQQYIDAEQAKSHKRMVGLCVFFVTLLVLVIGTFMVILWTVVNRNQSLSDRLIDLALNRSAQSVVRPEDAPVSSSAAHEAAGSAERTVLTQLLASFEKLADRVVTRQDQAVAVAPVTPASAVADRAEKTPAPAATPTASQPSAEAEELKQLRAVLLEQQRELKMERARRLKSEREAKHREEVERQRRKLYPEYYAREDARKAAEEEARALREESEQKGTPLSRASSPSPAPVRQPDGGSIAVSPVTPRATGKKLEPLTYYEDSEPKATVRSPSAKPLKPIVYFSEEESGNATAASSAVPPAKKTDSDQAQSPAVEVDGIPFLLPSQSK